MSELEDRINSVLNDPEQMEKIAGLAKSLMGNSEPPQSAAADSLGKLAQELSGGIDPALIAKLTGAMSRDSEGEKAELALLSAMRPFLSEKRREKMDRAIKLARIARIAGFALGETDAR